MITKTSCSQEKKCWGRWMSFEVVSTISPENKWIRSPCPQMMTKETSSPTKYRLKLMDTGQAGMGNQQGNRQGDRGIDRATGNRQWQGRPAKVGENKQKVLYYHAGETFMLAPLRFSLALQCSPFFHSRIATVTPVSHPLTRFIHIIPSCWTLYRSFEITLEMGTIHSFDLQIQCSTQIHCFKKRSVWYELCFNT